MQFLVFRQKYFCPRSRVELKKLAAKQKMSVSIPAVHPLQPLFDLEISAIKVAIETNAAYLAVFSPDPAPACEAANQLVYMEVLLKEPPKQYVLDFNAGTTTTVTRQARVVLYQNTTNFTYEVILNLNNSGAATVLTFEKLSYVGYPNNNFVNNADADDFGSTGANVNTNFLTRAQMNATCLANPALVAKLNARGITTLADDGDGYFAYPFYTFEALRNFSGCCGKLCPDLVDLDAPNHRYYPTVFFNYAIRPLGICIETANWGLLDDLYVIFDCTDNSIYRIIEDTKNVPRTVPVPAPVQDPYRPLYHPPMQPIYYAQPVVSFNHPGGDQYSVQWDNWSFRWSYQRGGLSIYNIGYQERPDSDPVPPRSIAYKAACSDTIVIYNVSDPLVARTYVSADSHNWPVLPRLTELQKGRDIPCYVPDANLYDIFLADGCGEPVTLRKAVAIYEQDADIMWRVNNGVIDVNAWPNGKNFNAEPPYPCGFIATGARKRQLVVRTIFSGFYYLFVYTYIFNQDGTMEFYTDLQGQTTNQWVVSDTTGKEVDNGHRIAKQQVALLHTHSCMYRIDFDIDGTSNVASEANAFRVCDKVKNPCGDAVEAAHHHFHTELEAIRSLNQKHNRVWEVSNESPETRNYLGFPRGYAVYFAGPNGNSTSLCTPNSAAHTHFPWMAHDLYVTKYRYGEEYASGEFPVLNVEPVGLSKYVKGDAHIENEDIVMWFNCKFFHEPHTENYPFISGHRIGLLLTPENFFDFNPACSIEYFTEATTASALPPNFALCTQATQPVIFNAPGCNCPVPPPPTP